MSVTMKLIALLSFKKNAMQLPPWSLGVGLPAYVLLFIFVCILPIKTLNCLKDLYMVGQL